MLHKSFMLEKFTYYELRLANYGRETVSKDASCARLLTSGASVQLFQAWHV